MDDPELPRSPRSPRSPRDYRPDLRPMVLLAVVLVIVIAGWILLSPGILPPGQ